MKRLSFILTALVTLAACSQVQPPANDAVLSLEPQILGTTAADRGKELAFVPRLGAVYLAGITKGSLDARNQGGFDIYLRRYKQNKTVVWSRQIASRADDIVGDIAADTKGQLYVGGRQGNKCFHSKYAADGTLLWKHLYSFCSPMAMAVDEWGNIYLSEVFSLEGGWTYELRKYSESRRQVYSTLIYGDLGDYNGIKDVAVDSRGNAYVYLVSCDDYCWDDILKVSSGGSVAPYGTFAMPPSSYPSYGDGVGGSDPHYRDLEVVGNALYAIGDKTYYTLPEDEDFGPFDHPFESDILVVKYTLGGVISWQRTFGTKVRDVGTTVTADTAGNVYAVGVSSGSLAARNAGQDDIVMRKFSALGRTLWTKQFGNASYDQVDDVIAYSGKELYLTGTTSGALEGGTYHGGKDGFLLRRDGSGNKVWTDQ